MTASVEASASISTSRAKIEGAFIALAAGDALGWPQELAARGRQHPRATPDFHEWEKRSGGRFYAHREVVRAGEYSDDTQLTAAVARSRLHAGKNWWLHFSRNELPLWTLYQRGGGRATKSAAGSWLRGLAPWKQTDPVSVRRYFEAGGNGVAMRVVPHAISYATEAEPANLLRDVVLDGAATHGHPRALIGAAAYAYAAWWLLRTNRTIGFGELVSILLDNASDWGTLPSASTTKNGWFEAANRNLGDYNNIWRQVVGEMTTLLTQVREGLAIGSLADDDEILHGLGAFGSSKGSGTVSAAAAIYLAARYASLPLQGVLRAAFAAGSDTDTLASMTGGLLGALAGTDWLPQSWFKVQDCEYLRELANRLAAQKPAYEERPSSVIGVSDVNAVLNHLLLGSRQPYDLGGGRYLQLLDSVDMEPISRHTLARGWHIRISDGQTIYVTKVGRRTDAGPRASAQQKLPVELAETRELAPQEGSARAAGVKITVSNLAASLDFYERLLGLSAQQKTGRFVSFGTISLVDGAYASQLSQGAVSIDHQDGRNRIEVHVSNLDSVQESLKDHGVHIAAPISKMPWGERSLHCLDPDGNVIEIVERTRL